MIKEHDLVVLKRAFPEEGLEQEDIGAVVHCYEDGKAFEVEFVSADGDTVAVLTLEKKDLRPFTSHEILHVRKLAHAV